MHDLTGHELAGLYAALPTAFDGNLGYDAGAQRRLAQHAIGQGLGGLFVGGSTAEVHSLTLDERLAGLADCAEAGRGRARLVAHVGAMREADTMQLASRARELGYDAVASTPPFYSPFSAGERRAFFERLVGNCGLPVFLYYIPSLTGLTLPHAEILDILALPGIVGMKLSSDDLRLLQLARQRLPQSCLLFGSDDLLMLALAAGADGGVGSTYNLFGQKLVELRTLVARGELEQARIVQKTVNAGIELLVAAGVFPALKAGLAAMGAACGPCRPPFGRLDEVKAARLVDGLRATGALSA